MFFRKSVTSTKDHTILSGSYLKRRHDISDARRHSRSLAPLRAQLPSPAISFLYLIRRLPGPLARLSEWRAVGHYSGEMNTHETKATRMHSAASYPRDYQNRGRWRGGGGNARHANVAGLHLRTHIRLDPPPLSPGGREACALWLKKRGGGGAGKKKYED